MAVATGSGDLRGKAGGVLSDTRPQISAIPEQAHSNRAAALNANAITAAEFVAGMKFKVAVVTDTRLDAAANIVTTDATDLNEVNGVDVDCK